MAQMAQFSQLACILFELLKHIHTLSLLWIHLWQSIQILNLLSGNDGR